MYICIYIYIYIYTHIYIYIYRVPPWKIPHQMPYREASQRTSDTTAGNLLGLAKYRVSYLNVEIRVRNMLPLVDFCIDNRLPMLRYTE